MTADMHVEVWWPLLLSTAAGLSTSIGGAIAISLAPDEATLAFLLGSAVGVMSTVSIVELWLHKALQHASWFGITAAVAAGAMAFAILDPLLPKSVEHQHSMQDKCKHQDHQPLLVQVHKDCEPQVTVATSMKRQGIATRQSGIKPELAGRLSVSNTSSPKATPAGVTIGSHSSGCDTSSLESQTSLQTFVCDGLSSQQHQRQQQHYMCSSDAKDCAPQHTIDVNNSTAGGHLGSNHDSSDEQIQLQLLRSQHAGLMRLGLLMAMTMTLHNMPEGFAVAFSAMTSVGPMMCGAIAMHNIPEGLVIAAPIYAATGSKVRALAIATLSGLSEPLGACIALFVFKPFVSSIRQLDYVLAFVGGIMLAVCALELWPEGRRCRQHARLLQGLAVGSILMGWTLYVGV